LSQREQFLLRYAALLGCLFALVYAVMFIRSNLFGLGIPYYALGLRGSPSDFAIYIARARDLDGHSFFTAPGHPFTYPAPVLLVFKFYVNKFAAPAAAYLWTVAVLWLVAAVWLITKLRQFTDLSVAILFVVTASVTSYPLWFLLERENIEGIVVAVLALAAIAYARRNLQISALLLGIAIALKLFPVILLGVCVARRQWRHASLAWGTAALVTLGSLLYIGPTLRSAAHDVSGGLSAFSDLYVYTYRPLEAGFDHSLFSLYKQTSALFLANPEQGLHQAYPLYLLSFAVGGLVFFCTKLRRLPLINQWLALTIACILLPPVSYDYTLTHLYVPWVVLLLVFIRNVEVPRIAYKFMYLFALLFTAQPLLLFQNRPWSAQFKTVILLALLYLAVTVPLKYSDATGLENEEIEKLPSA